MNLFKYYGSMHFFALTFCDSFTTEVWGLIEYSPLRSWAPSGYCETTLCSASSICEN